MAFTPSVLRNIINSQYVIKQFIEWKIGKADISVQWCCKKELPLITDFEKKIIGKDQNIRGEIEKKPFG